MGRVNLYVEIRYGNTVFTRLGNTPEDLRAKAEAMLGKQNYLSNEITTLLEELKLKETEVISSDVIKADLDEIIRSLNSEDDAKLIISCTDLTGYKYPEAYTTEALALRAAQMRVQNILRIYESGLFDVDVSDIISYLSSPNVATLIGILLDLSGRARYPAAAIAETNAAAAADLRNGNIATAIRLGLLQKSEFLGKAR